jgi:hypothetical protein
MFRNPLAFLTSPTREWQYIADAPADAFDVAALYPVFCAIIPAVAWYYGTTQVGWTVGDGDVVKLTEASAFRIICAFYLVMVGSVLAIGYSIYWMSMTYGCETSFAKGIAISGYTATPLFIAGLLGFHPLLWVDLVLGTAAACWAVYLLYMGVPIVMKIPEEKGFLYSSAILAVCLVLVICILVVTVILWDMGFMPVFTD